MPRQSLTVEDLATTLLSGSSSANFPTIAGAGVTLTTDTSVTYQGQPTTRVFVPAALATFFEVGVPGATIAMPQWGSETPQPGQFGLVVMTDKASRVSSVSHYLGDATYANFATSSMATIDLPSDNEWITFFTAQPWSTGGGTPAYTGSRRWKIRVQVTAGQDMYFWIAKLIAIPRERGAVCFVSDDGYDEHYSYLFPACVSRDVPHSIGIDYGLIDTAEFMTRAQLVEINASNVVELVNHGYLNQSYTAVGAAAYLRNALNCRAYLNDVGVGASASAHVWVQGANGNDVIDLMKEQRFTHARVATTVQSTGYKRSRGRWSPRSTYRIPISGSLENTLTLAQAKAAVDSAIKEGSLAVFMGHKFEAAAAALTWATADMDALLDYVVLKKKQGLIDTLKFSQVPRWLAGARATA